MPKVFLTPVLIAGLLLLPSCSSSETKACEAAKKAYLDLSAQSRALGESIKILEQGSLILQAQQKRKEQLFTAKAAFLVKINNQSCFTPEEVSIAQLLLKEIEKYEKSVE